MLTKSATPKCKACAGESWVDFVRPQTRLKEGGVQSATKMKYKKEYGASLRTEGASKASTDIFMSR